VVPDPRIVPAPKLELRHRYRARRDALAAGVRHDLSAAICVRALGALPASIRCAGLYAAVGSEVETATLDRALRSQGCAIAYPRCVDVRTAERALVFCRVENLDELRPGAFGLSEPLDAQPLASLHLEAVIVPGVAFDRLGRRLGYGGGYYDRWLAAFTGLSVGLCFEAQIVEDLPEDAHDVRLQTVITEARVLGAAATP
jgi:5-formyltetrahydrofolate cyclo-ligase